MPTITAMLCDTEPDLTAFAAFPIGHRKKIWSNNPIKQVNTEIKHRIDIIQVFPNNSSISWRCPA